MSDQGGRVLLRCGISGCHAHLFVVQEVALGPTTAERTKAMEASPSLSDSVAFLIKGLWQPGLN